MTETYSNYADGDWREADTGETTEVRNPANTDDILGEYQRSSADDAAAAIEAAAGAPGEWVQVLGTERGAILREGARRLDDHREGASSPRLTISFARA